MKPLLVATCFYLVILTAGIGSGQPAPLVVSAATSLSTVMNELARHHTGPRVSFNFGGSNTLARQIVEGARVDVFISADAAQMDVVERAGKVRSDTRVNLLSNELVIVVPTSATVTVRGPADLADGRVRRIAMGEPSAVPAGVYGRQWLLALGLWSVVERKVIPFPTVRAALAAVSEGRVDAGLVYATDVRPSADVRVVHTARGPEAPKIVYPAAVIVGSREAEARAFLDFLRSSGAQKIFEAAGFQFLAHAR